VNGDLGTLDSLNFYTAVGTLANTTSTSASASASINMPIHVLDKYYLGLTAIITVGYQLAFFAVAFYLHFDKLTGGCTP
jgi:hypothetical protein